MKTSAKMGGAAALGVLAGLVMGWLARGWWWPDPTHPAVAERANPGAVLPVFRQRGEAGSGSLRKLVEQLNSGDSRPALEFATAQFDSYLQRHRRDAGSLLAVYRITKDKALLREAYEKFPEDPHVADQVLAALDLSLEEKLAMLEKVRRTHPGNPLGDFLTCVALVKEGKFAEGLGFLQEGLAKPGLDFGLREQRLDLREALMSAGKSPTEARVLGGALATSELPFGLVEVAKQSREETKRLLQGQREDEAFTLAGQLLALSQRVEASPDRTLVNELNALFMRQATLVALPDDVEIGDTGQTASALIADFESNFHRPDVESMRWHMLNLDDTGVELYYQFAEQRGERAALEWAEAYHGPAPAKSE